MPRHKYSDEFKWLVVNEYFKGDLGVRRLANKYNLPSKNYITNWINKFKKEGKLDNNISRNKSKTKSKSTNITGKTPYERELERKNYELEAKLAFYKKYEELLQKDSRKKK